MSYLAYLAYTKNNPNLTSPIKDMFHNDLL